MDPFCTTEIIFAKKHEAEEILLSIQAKHLVLLLSKTAAARWNLEEFVSSLATRFDSCIWIKTIPANPTQEDILQTLKLIGDMDVDKIIAIGGGSAIDLAKAVSAFYDPKKNSSYTLEDITTGIKNKSYSGDSFIDIIALPSTAGTGSEITQWATIWDEHKHGKYSIDAPELKPKLALIVPELTMTLSPLLTLSTGLDAMSHAVEAYWSKHTTPIVQEIAYRAIELVLVNLKYVLASPLEYSFRENMCRASVLAGIAFSKTRTTACHSISYPMTQLYNVPHGIAVALTLNAVASLNRGHFAHDDELFLLFERFGGLSKWIDSVSKGIISLRLESFEIEEDDIRVIADHAFTGGRMDNNPVNLTRDDVQTILHRILR